MSLLVPTPTQPEKCGEIMNSDIFYTEASENSLIQIISGNYSIDNFATKDSVDHLSVGNVGVFLKPGAKFGDVNKPIAVISRKDELRRLVGRFAQLRSDFSPLSAWCHVFVQDASGDPYISDRLAFLNGFEAACAGLAIAETQVLTGRPLASLRISACLATQSFAIARGKALWSEHSSESILKKFDSAHRIFKLDTNIKNYEPKSIKLRPRFQPIWNCIDTLVSDNNAYDLQSNVLAKCLFDLKEARINHTPNEAEIFAKNLGPIVSIAEKLFDLDSLSPEQRLHLFDAVIDQLNSPNSNHSNLSKNALQLLAGYLSTIAAGGSPSLGLAESNMLIWPEILGWAYFVGGIGERVLWTSSFDGLGRLVSRELLRNFRIEDPPMCDCSLDEAEILYDQNLKDPLVHLRIKQSRSVSVALLPGLNLTVSLQDQPILEDHIPLSRSNEKPKMVPLKSPDQDPIKIFADLIMPYITPYINEIIKSKQENRSKFKNQESYTHQNKRKSTYQPKLPLQDEEK